MAEPSYDYIIAGGGLAGLSLAFLLSRSSLRTKKVLVIDRDEKSANDRTWCFWERGASHFEQAVFHRWKKLLFFSCEGKRISLDLAADGLEYKMIRADEFYRFVRTGLDSLPHFEFRCAKVTEVNDGRIETDIGGFRANEFVFDSVSRPAYDDPRSHNLLQHFYGRVIETGEESFDPGAATLFDFRGTSVDECRFVYLLPLTKRRALVEYTVFSDRLLEDREYAEGLENYLGSVAGITRYETLEEERGVIPMSDAHHDTRPSPKVVRIGTAGGYVKPSTGYSFSRTQDRLAEIVQALETGRPIPEFRSVRSGWKMLLDSTMLNILSGGDPPASDVFSRLFQKNPASRVLDFLDEETSITEDLAVMRTVPLVPFAKAAISELLRSRGGFRRKSNQ